jgi:hypothetical protein
MLEFELDEGHCPGRFATFVTYVERGELPQRCFAAVQRSLKAKAMTGACKLRRVLTLPVRNFFRHMDAPEHVTVIVLGLRVPTSRDRAPFAIRDVVTAALAEGGLLDEVRRQHLAGAIAGRRLHVPDLPTAELLEREFEAMVEAHERAQARLLALPGGEDDEPAGGELREAVYGPPPALEHCTHYGDGPFFKYVAERPRLERRVDLLLGRWGYRAVTAATLPALLDCADELAAQRWIPAQRNPAAAAELLLHVARARTAEAGAAVPREQLLEALLQRRRARDATAEPPCRACGQAASGRGDVCSYACWRAYYGQALCGGCQRPLAAAERLRQGHRCAHCGGADVLRARCPVRATLPQPLWWCVLGEY